MTIPSTYDSSEEPVLSCIGHAELVALDVTLWLDQYRDCLSNVAVLTVSGG